MEYQDIIGFWFSDSVRKNWWKKDKAFDRALYDHFSDCYQQACKGSYQHWRNAPEGRLAEIIVLDQFSRNFYRNDARAYAQDELARKLCREAIKSGDDKQLTPQQRAFLYMPLMHSEFPEDHEEALKLYASHPELSSNLKFERKHKVIIDQFGRYPHRNKDLGRESTAEELLFLEQAGSSF